MSQEETESRGSIKITLLYVVILIIIDISQVDTDPAEATEQFIKSESKLFKCI